MNINKIAAWEKEIKLRAAALQKELGDAQKKGISAADVRTYRTRLNAIQSEQTAAAEERATYERAMKMVNYGSSKGYEPDSTEGSAVKPSSLHISEADCRGLYEAVQKRQTSYRIEAKSLTDVMTKAPFGTGDFTSGSLPPALLPQLTAGLPYENDDIFSHFLQQKAPEANSVEFLQHTGNTNPAAATAELAQKPELGMQWKAVTTSFTKIAAIDSFSDESLSDFSYFGQIVPQEMFAALQDARSDEIVNGSGSTPHMAGLLNASGTLTRAMGDDTPVDCLRKAINDLRIGSAFTKADLILLNPTTWADLQLQKSSQGLYLLNPNDPNTLGDLDNIFGVRVVENTKVPAGKAIVLDTTKAVLAWRRSGPTIDINAYGTDEFEKNYVTFRVEERVAIGVRYPTAVNLVSGLPSS